MFTGIIEEIGEINTIKKDGTNLQFTIKSNLSKSLKIDQSVAHNGVCLTVVKIDGNKFTVTAIFLFCTIIAISSSIDMF